MGAKITLTSPSEAFGVLPSRAARTENLPRGKTYFLPFHFQFNPIYSSLENKTII